MWKRFSAASLGIRTFDREFGQMVLPALGMLFKTRAERVSLAAADGVNHFAFLVNEVEVQSV